MRLMPSHSSRFQSMTLFLLDEPENSTHMSKLSQVRKHDNSSYLQKKNGLYFHGIVSYKHKPEENLQLLDMTIDAIHQICGFQIPRKEE